MEQSSHDGNGIGRSSARRISSLVMRFPSKSNRTFYASDLINLETLHQNAGGAVGVKATNSWISIQSEGIDKVARRGAEVVPSLVRIMETPGISFDTFARCFVACQKILSQKQPEERLYWDGGADVKHEGGTFRLYPFGQVLDEKGFRSKVVKSIREKLLGGPLGH